MTKSGNVAVIPARGGSERVKNKNIRYLKEHPLLAYTIAISKSIDIFDYVVCSTDSEQIARVAIWYGVDEVIMRPSEISTSISPDIEWIEHALKSGLDRFEYFSIMRATSPIKSKSSILGAMNSLKIEGADSIRAIKRVREHPGKMWKKDISSSARIYPILNLGDSLSVAWHARQYQDLPTYYVQTSSFEIAKTQSIIDFGTREGKVILGYEVDFPETITIDYEDEFLLLEVLLDRGLVELPQVIRRPFESEVAKR
jgi:CMP-N-acetylneuraminic acid synthetase